MPVAKPKTRIKTRRKVKVYGRYIVSDPAVCHGRMTFRGTRIFVDDVIEQVAEGMVFESISESWGGKVRKEAIAEAIRLAHEALREGKLEAVEAVAE
ncbi:MAG TPA: DUF433 domain-containing protein [Tepidisphaeraceae bacterium]|jgi:uncharacterized protein (DUF433 family)